MTCPPRRSVRLRTWDYAAAAWYSVTICTHGRASVFGHVEEAHVALSRLGALAEACLLAIPAHNPRAVLDAWVVMPNHVHALIGLVGEHVDGAGLGRAGPGSLGAVVGSYKAAVTRGARAEAPPFRWQRGFYEHVVRNEATLERHRRYIEENPARWEADRYHRR